MFARRRCESQTENIDLCTNLPTEPKLCHYNYNLEELGFNHFDVKDNLSKRVSRQQLRGKINKFKTKEDRINYAEKIIEKARTSNKWSNKNYNKNLGYLKAILSRLEEWEIIENNPAHKIATLPVTESEKSFLTH